MASDPPKIRRGLAGKDVLESFENLLSQQKTIAAPEAVGSGDEFDPNVAATREIAARIQAAVLDATASDADGEQQQDAQLIEDIVAPELFEEEFRARVIALVREGLVREAEAGSEIDRRQHLCFEEAILHETIVVERAEQVEGLFYRATRSVLYGADGRVTDDGASESWDDEFVFSEMAKGKAVIIGSAEAIGEVDASHYYVSFPNPDVLLTFDQQLYRLTRHKAEEP
ncbi:hypothetical protein [Microvirga puerhi]|uniref:Uncharacterized protein n=1 Tax=Microvirga puerhi TaxID=2876078 RepID=A0ABS7VHY2_9HYPH|nr:hypothetical protein [Microvirga puerhi]MBZ6074700.1 hypothetical protein [Microvirga puerhi]